MGVPFEAAAATASATFIEDSLDAYGGEGTPEGRSPVLLITAGLPLTQTGALAALGQAV